MWHFYSVCVRDEDHYGSVGDWQRLVFFAWDDLGIIYSKKCSLVSVLVDVHVCEQHQYEWSI